MPVCIQTPSLLAQALSQIFFCRELPRIPIPRTRVNKGKILSLIDAQVSSRARALRTPFRTLCSPSIGALLRKLYPFNRSFQARCFAANCRS
jgi:hypothetical protein